MTVANAAEPRRQRRKLRRNILLEPF
jgi:hypothetical protein